MLVPRRLTFWIGLAALLAVAGIAFQVLAPRRPPSPRLEPPGDTTDGVVLRALDQIPVDSLALKSQWRDEVQDLDVTMLTTDQTRRVVRFANARRCTCGCGYTLAACRRYDTTCPVSLPILEALRDSIRAGHLRDVSGLRPAPAESDSERVPSG